MMALDNIKAIYCKCLATTNIWLYIPATLLIATVLCELEPLDPNKRPLDPSNN